MRPPIIKRSAGRTTFRAGGAAAVAALALVIAAATPAATVAFDSAVNFTVANFGNVVAVGDLNRDGKRDLVQAGTTVSVLLGDGAGGFGASTDFAAGSLERGVVIADFNGDAKPDVAVTNRNSSGTVSVLLGNGSGGLGAATTFTVGSRPTGIAAGDLNDDGRPDLVVANQNSTFYSVLIGTGSGSFGGATSYSVTAACATFSPPVDVQLGDVNADGKLDLVGSTDCGAVVGLGDGTGGFGTPQLWSAAGLNGFGFSIAVGDLNGDGKLDFVAGEDHFINPTNHYYFNVMLGDGAGSFTAGSGSPIQVSYSQGGIAIADVNGDDAPDITIGDSDLPRVSVLPGNGDGSFGAEIGPFAVGTGNSAEAANSIAAADLDGDAKPDLAVPTGNQPPGGGVLSVLFNATAFDSSFGTPVTNAAGDAPAAVAIDDLDGDGMPDVVVANADGDSVSVQTNSTSTDPSFGSTTSVVSNPRHVAIGDFNKDAKPDKVTLSDSDVTVQLGNGNGGFGVASSLGLTNAASAAIADADGDGKPDLFLAGGGGPSPFEQPTAAGMVSLFKGNGSGGFAPRTDFATDAPPTGVTTGDFNRDGKLDVAVARSDLSGLRLLQGNGTGGFPTAVDFPAGGAASSVAAGDVNGDGKADLAVTNDGSSTVSVLVGNGNFGFSSTTSLSVGTDPRSVAIGDLDGDQKLDLAVANAGSNTVSTLKGIGTGAFQPAVNRSTGASSSPRRVLIAEVDDDGRRDLVTANNGTDNISILRGDGAGSFKPAIQKPVGGTAPVDVAVGDVNRDGKPDLLTANGGSSDVSLLTNQLRPPTFTPGPTLPLETGSHPVALATAELNGDGKPDIVTANRETSKVSVLRSNNALANRPAGYDPPSNFSTGAKPKGVAIRDMNGDNIKDIVVAREDTNGVAVLPGLANGSFGPPTAFAGGGPADSIAITDVNADTKPDVAVTNAATSQVTVMLGNGTGGFMATNSFSVGTNPLSVALGDLDDDLGVDLAVGNRDSSDVTVLKGHSDGIFDSPTTVTLPVNSQPVSLAIRDVNGDRRPDIAVANRGTSIVALLLSRKSGGFTATAAGPTGGPRDSVSDVGVGSGPSGVQTDDLNLDGVPDLATSNENDDNTSSVPNITLVDTATSLGSSTSSPTPGTPITYTATVSPPPLGGTMSFLENGSPISGCDFLAVNTTTGVATCQMTYDDEIVHTITAEFSGDGFYAPSASSPLTETVANPPTAVVVQSFSAHRARGGVQLRWRTAQEVGLLGFDVYRSTGSAARKLNRALIPRSARSSAAGATYVWLDRSAPLRGRLVYRLRAVRVDGARPWLRTVVVRR